MPHQPLSIDEWSTYWKNDTLTTFMQTFAGNYDHEIKDFWYDCFSTLPDDANLIDFATGNGAIALLAMQFSEENKKDFSVTAIDLANINPSHHLTLTDKDRELFEKIRFIGNTNICDTGLPSCTFNAVLSQYGIEYSKQDACIPEIARLLKPHGKLFAICHSTTSLVVEQARESLEQIDICLTDTTLMELSKSLILRIGDINHQNQLLHLELDPVIKQLRAQYNSVINSIEIQLQRFKNRYISDFILSSLIGLIQKPLGKTANQNFSELETILEHTQSYKKRMHDLLFAAINDHKKIQMMDLMQNNNLCVSTFSDFYYKENDLLGYSICAEAI